MNDLRFAFRQLLKNPGFTAVAVLTLALGIGATTAIYSAVQTTLLDPLPVKDADRLMSIESFNTLKGYSSGGVSLNTIAELQRHKEVFANVAVHNAMLAKYRGRDFIEMVRGSQVSANFFALWGVQPVLGRVFSKDEGRPEASRVVVLSHSFWRTRLGGDPQIIGKTIEFEPETESAYQRYTVIGVMPGHFVFPQQDIYFWIPKSHPDMEQRFRNLSVCFRLPIGSTALQAQAILDVISARDAVADPKFNEGWRMRLFPVSAMFADEATRQRLWTLFAVIGLVWLIACANVANLLLARAEGRQHELAMRAALGAGRARLIRQLLTESLLLAMAAGLCGLVLSHWGVEALRAFLGGIRLKPLALNGAVFSSALAFSVVTGIVFGLAPAWRASRPRLSETLKQAGASSTQTAQGRWLLRGLIVGEIAFAAVILAGAGLMIRSVIHVLRLDLGYDPRNLLMAVAVPSSATTGDAQTYSAFVNRLGDDYATLPGPQSVGIRTVGGRRKYIAEGDDQAIEVQHEGSGLEDRNLFAALGVPLVEGRFLDRSDVERTTVVVNRTLARTFWPGRRAVGKRLRTAPGQDRTTDPRTLQEGVFEVVGVVGDVRLDDHETDLGPIMYRPCQEFYEHLHYDRFYIRTAADPTSLVRPIHAAINQADPGVIDRTIQNVSAELYRSTQGRRFFTLYLTLYAAVGLVLATIGLYGLVAYSVRRRTREFGIRLALGSTPKAIMVLVMRGGMKLALVGLAFGLAGALVGNRFLQSQLHGVSPHDPVTFAILIVVLFLAATAASFIPGRRAAKVDPMEALRYE